ncbi:MAG: hypothetical protein ACJA1E_000373 [Paracoccaceae bacterium]
MFNVERPTLKSDETRGRVKPLLIAMRSSSSELQCDEVLPVNFNVTYVGITTGQIRCAGLSAKADAK